MKPKLKICGIQTLEEIRLLNQYPLDYIGFIFAPSRRQVTIEQVARMRGAIREDIQVVGVFVDASLKDVNEAVQVCGLDLVQLHGQETDAYCKQVEAPCWKSISMKDQHSIDQLENYQHVDGFLLDTHSHLMKGGTGKTFSWEWVKGISRDYPIILAGGLKPENITLAANQVRPHVLDVNSGVEVEGYKDPKRIEALFREYNRIEGGNNYE